MINPPTAEAWLALLTKLHLIVKEHNANASRDDKLCIGIHAYNDFSHLLLGNDRCTDAQVGRLICDYNSGYHRMGVQIRDDGPTYSLPYAPTELLSCEDLILFWNDWNRLKFRTWHLYLKFAGKVFVCCTQQVTDQDRARLLALPCVQQCAKLAFENVPIEQRSAVVCNHKFRSFNVELVTCLPANATSFDNFGHNDTVVNRQSDWRALRSTSLKPAEDVLRTKDVIRILSGRRLGAGRDEPYGCAWSNQGSHLPDVIWPLIAAALPSHNSLPASVKQQAGLQLLMPIHPGLKFANQSQSQQLTISYFIKPEWRRLCQWLCDAPGRFPGIGCGIQLEHASNGLHPGRSGDVEFNAQIAKRNSCVRTSNNSVWFGGAYHERNNQAAGQLGNKFNDIDFLAFAANWLSDWQIMRIRFIWGRTLQSQHGRLRVSLANERVLEEFAQQFPVIADASDPELSVLSKFVEGDSAWVEFVVYQPAFLQNYNKNTDELIGHFDWRSALSSVEV